MGSNGDLISRSALKEKIHDFVYGYRTPKISKGDLEHGLNMFFVDKAPAVDAVEVVHCEQCLYRSQYANEEGLYKCGVITCKEGHCAMVAPYFSCIAGKKRGNDDG